MLVAAAVCPHPPMLVPGVAAGATPELDDLRTAAGRAVRVLQDARPDLVVVVGVAPTLGPCPPDSSGSLAAYGVDVRVGASTGPATLPLSLTIGLWLLEQLARDLPRLLFGVPADSDPRRCADLGATLAQRAARVALLVMGDGSARRSLKGPGYLDERAEPFDRDVEDALATADADRLLRLDPGLAGELLVAGRAPWQVMAGAASAGGLTWAGEVSYAQAPNGVSYVVATWLPAG